MKALHRRGGGRGGGGKDNDQAYDGQKVYPITFGIKHYWVLLDLVSHLTKDILICKCDYHLF